MIIQIDAHALKGFEFLDALRLIGIVIGPFGERGHIGKFLHVGFHGDFHIDEIGNFPQVDVQILIALFFKNHMGAAVVDLNLKPARALTHSEFFAFGSEEFRISNRLAPLSVLNQTDEIIGLGAGGAAENTDQAEEEQTKKDAFHRYSTK